MSKMRAGMDRVENKESKDLKHKYGSKDRLDVQVKSQERLLKATLNAPHSSYLTNTFHSLLQALQDARIVQDARGYAYNMNERSALLRSMSGKVQPIVRPAVIAVVEGLDATFRFVDRFIANTQNFNNEKIHLVSDKLHETTTGVKNSVSIFLINSTSSVQEHKAKLVNQIYRGKDSLRKEMSRLSSDFPLIRALQLWPCILLSIFATMICYIMAIVDSVSAKSVTWTENARQIPSRISDTKIILQNTMIQWRAQFSDRMWHPVQGYISSHGYARFEDLLGYPHYFRHLCMVKLAKHYDAILQSEILGGYLKRGSIRLQNIRETATSFFQNMLSLSRKLQSKTSTEPVDSS